MKWRKNKIRLKKDDFDKYYFEEFVREFVRKNKYPPDELDIEPRTYFVTKRGKLLAIVDCEIEYWSSGVYTHFSSYECDISFKFKLVASKVKTNCNIMGLERKGDYKEIELRWDLVIE